MAPGYELPVIDTGKRPWLFGIVGSVRFELRRVSGTSYASPIVAGLAATLLELEPTLTVDQLRAPIIATLEGNDLDPLLAVTLVDPDAPGYSVGSTSERQHCGAGFYYSATAVADRDRLVGMGQLYVANRAVFPRPLNVLRHRMVKDRTSHLHRRADDRDHRRHQRRRRAVHLTFAPGQPVITSDVGGCRNMHRWADDYFQDAATLAAKVNEATVTTQLERTREHADVRAAVYAGRCEPIRTGIVGGCDTRSTPADDPRFSTASKPRSGGTRADRRQPTHSPTNQHQPARRAASPRACVAGRLSPRAASGIPRLG